MLPAHAVLACHWLEEAIRMGRSLLTKSNPARTSKPLGMPCTLSGSKEPCSEGNPGSMARCYSWFAHALESRGSENYVSWTCAPPKYYSNASFLTSGSLSKLCIYVALSDSWLSSQPTVYSIWLSSWWWSLSRRAPQGHSHRGLHAAE